MINNLFKVSYCFKSNAGIEVTDILVAAEDMPHALDYFIKNINYDEIKCISPFYTKVLINCNSQC